MNADIIEVEKSFGHKFGDLDDVPLEKLLAIVIKKLDGNSTQLISEIINHIKR